MTGRIRIDGQSIPFAEGQTVIQAATDAEKAKRGVAKDRLALKVRGLFGEDVRKSGLKNYLDEPYEGCVRRMQEFNRNRLYATALGIWSK